MTPHPHPPHLCGWEKQINKQTKNEAEKERTVIMTTPLTFVAEGNKQTKNVAEKERTVIMTTHPYLCGWGKQTNKECSRERKNSHNDHTTYLCGWGKQTKNVAEKERTALMTTPLTFVGERNKQTNKQTNKQCSRERKSPDIMTTHPYLCRWGKQTNKQRM